jgi:hypothetical protein
MLNGCDRCGWVQRSHRATALNSRCPRCGHPTSALRYEGVYGPPRPGRRGDRATTAIQAEDDARRC